MGGCAALVPRILVNLSLRKEIIMSNIPGYCNHIIKDPFVLHNIRIDRDHFDALEYDARHHGMTVSALIDSLFLDMLKCRYPNDPTK